MATFLLHVPLLADPSAEVPEWWADRGQGGGWLGAHGSQLIDQIRVTLGEFESVAASLPHVAGPAMTAEDADSRSDQFRRQSPAQHPSEGHHSAMAAGPVAFAVRLPIGLRLSWAHDRFDTFVEGADLVVLTPSVEDLFELAAGVRIHW